MTQAIVAIYDDIVVARQVVEDLVKADFDRNSISLITNDSQNQYSHYLDKDYTPREDAVTAVEGAGFGAVAGTLTGILVGLAALTIPGIGLAVVAGPIVAGLTGALAGAVTGGIVGALVKSGVPEDEAPYYAEGIRRGGTLISVQTSETLNASDIMNRNGSINIHERSSQWRQLGWQGFNVESTDEEATSKSSGIPPVIISDSPTLTPHTSHNADPVTFVPIQPIAGEEDTEILIHEGAIVTTTHEATVPLASGSDAMEAAPVPLVLEEDLHREYEYTDDDFQAIEPITNPSKG